MPAPFILRFQEDCATTEAPSASSGTQTKTAIHAEQSDSDPGRTQYDALAQSVAAETGTKTRVLGEHSDEGRGVFHAGGTQTATSVRAEAGDTDRHAQLHRAFSQCSLS